MIIRHMHKGKFVISVKPAFLLKEKGDINNNSNESENELTEISRYKSKCLKCVGDLC